MSTSPNGFGQRPVIRGPQGDMPKLIVLGMILLFAVGALYSLKQMSEVVPSDSSGDTHDLHTRDTHGSQTPVKPVDDNETHETDPIRSRLSQIPPGPATEPLSVYFDALEHMKGATPEYIGERVTDVRAENLLRSPRDHQGTWVRLVAQPAGRPDQPNQQYRTKERLPLGNPFGDGTEVYVSWWTVTDDVDDWIMVVSDSFIAPPKAESSELFNHRYEIEGLFFKLFEYKALDNRQRRAIVLLSTSFADKGVINPEITDLQPLFLFAIAITIAVMFLLVLIRRNSGPEQPYHETLAEVRTRRRDRAKTTPPNDDSKSETQG
jgi:hypothetical protein